MLVKMFKWIFSKIICKSSCSYNIEEEIFNSNIMDDKLSNYDLTLKDIKKVYKILIKKEKSIIPQSQANQIRSISI